jgi:hypothetical protein
MSKNIEPVSILEKIMYVVSIILVVFIVATIFVGCSVSSLLFESRPAVSQVLIERSPTRVTYIGDISDENNKFVIKCIDTMQKDKFTNYKFNENTNFNTDAASVLSHSKTHIFDSSVK